MWIVLESFCATTNMLKIGIALFSETDEVFRWDGAATTVTTNCPSRLRP
jgi:hypothetical protein